MSESAVSMFRGDSHVVSVTVKAADGAGVLSVLDITGCTLTLSVKKRGSADYLIQVAGEIEDGPNGVATFTFAPLDTSTKPPATYTYDVQISMPGGSIYTLLHDSFELKEDVTL